MGGIWARAMGKRRRAHLWHTGHTGPGQAAARAVGGFEGAAAAPSDRNPVGLVLAKACVQTSAVRSRAGAIGCPLLDEHQAQSGTQRGERECAGGSARAPWGMRGEIRPVAGRRGWCRSWSASRSTAAAWARTGWDCKKNKWRKRGTKNSCGWAFGSLASNRGRAGSAGTAAGVGCEAEGVGAGVSRAAGLTVLRQGPARRHQPRRAPRCQLRAQRGRWPVATRSRAVRRLESHRHRARRRGRVAPP